MKTSFAAAATFSTIFALLAPGASTQAQQMRTFHCIATSVAPSKLNSVRI